MYRLMTSTDSASHNDANHIVHAVRKQLGKFNDNTAVLLRSHKRKLSLDPRVKTDVQLLMHALDSVAEMSSAEALMTLERAHRLVEGPPFDAKDYSWAHDQHFVSEATEVVAEAPSHWSTERWSWT
jgi:two-component SAPR family response regulator